MKSWMLSVLVILAVATTALLSGANWVPTSLAGILALTLVWMNEQRPLLDWVYPRDVDNNPSSDKAN